MFIICNDTIKLKDVSPLCAHRLRTHVYLCALSGHDTSLRKLFEKDNGIGGFWEDMDGWVYLVPCCTN
jgi:hypothetical protein